MKKRTAGALFCQATVGSRLRRGFGSGGKTQKLQLFPQSWTQTSVFLGGFQNKRRRKSSNLHTLLKKKGRIKLGHSSSPPPAGAKCGGLPVKLDLLGGFFKPSVVSLAVESHLKDLKKVTGCHESVVRCISRGPFQIFKQLKIAQRCSSRSDCQGLPPMKYLCFSVAKPNWLCFDLPHLS